MYRLIDGCLSPKGFNGSAERVCAERARAHSCYAYTSVYAQAHAYMRVHARLCIRAMCLYLRMHQRSSCDDFATRSRRPKMHRETHQH